MVLGKSAGLFLGVNQFAVGLDVEDTAGAFDQFRFDIQLFLERIRQTGGLGVIVSHHAVFDADVHGILSIGCSSAACGRMLSIVNH